MYIVSDFSFKSHSGTKHKTFGFYRNSANCCSSVITVKMYYSFSQRKIHMQWFSLKQHGRETSLRSLEQSDETVFSACVFVRLSVCVLVPWGERIVVLSALLCQNLQLSQTFYCGGGCGRSCWDGSSPCCCELGGRSGPNPLPEGLEAQNTVIASSWCCTPEASHATATPLVHSPLHRRCRLPSSPAGPPDIIQLATSVYAHPLINRLDSEHIDAGIGLIDHIQLPWLGFQR